MDRPDKRKTKKKKEKEGVGRERGVGDKKKRSAPKTMELQEKRLCGEHRGLVSLLGHVSLKVGRVIWEPQRVVPEILG